jgi:hypothetical protein
MKNTPQNRNWISWMRRPAASGTLALAVVLLPAVITTQSAQAQTFTTRHCFDNTDGADPYAGLVEGTDGNRDNLSWRGQRRWHSLQNHPRRIEMVGTPLREALFRYRGKA